MKYELPKYNGNYVIDNDYWTVKLMQDAIKKIDKRIPIYVPSYNRYEEGAAHFLAVMRDYSTWPVNVVVRQFQGDEYKKTYDRPHIQIITVPDDDITNAGLAHAKCVEVCEENSLFVIDDDIIPYVNALAYNKESDKYKSMKIHTIDNFDYVFSAWQYIHEYLLSKYKDCCCTTIEDGLFNFAEKSLEDTSYLPHKFMCGVCFDKSRMNGLNYRSCDEYGHDDIDLMFMLLQEGKYPLSIKPITFVSGKYEKWGFDSMNDRLTYQFNMLNNNWGLCEWARINKEKLIFTAEFRKYFKHNPNVYWDVKAKHNLSEELGYNKKPEKHELW